MNNLDEFANRMGYNLYLILRDMTNSMHEDDGIEFEYFTRGAIKMMDAAISTFRKIGEIKNDEN